MIAGHLQIKNDNYYMVLNYTDANGNAGSRGFPQDFPQRETSAAPRSCCWTPARALSRRL